MSEGLQQLLMLGLVMVGGFFLLIWPQMRARKQQEKKMASLQPGDWIVTIGGFVAQLTAIDRGRNLARIQLADGVEVQILVNAIGRKMELQELRAEPASEPEEAEVPPETAEG